MHRCKHEQIRLGSGGRTAHICASARSKLLRTGLMTEPATIASKLSSRRTETTLSTTKKDPSEDESFFVVAQVHSNWNNVRADLARWKALSRGDNLLA